MEKKPYLTIEDIIHFLPYNLSAIGGNVINIDVELNEVQVKSHGARYMIVNQCIMDTKPFLNPYKYIKNEYQMIYEKFDLKLWKSDFNIEEIPYNVVMYLISRKYDVFKLIDKGLAVNIHEYYETNNKIQESIKKEIINSYKQ